MISREKRLRVFQRDGYCCRYCGWEAARPPQRRRLTIDHVVPRSKGGTDNIQNLAAACGRCNQEKADRLITPGARIPSTGVRVRVPIVWTSPLPAELQEAS